MEDVAWDVFFGIIGLLVLAFWAAVYIGIPLLVILSLVKFLSM